MRRIKLKTLFLPFDGLLLALACLINPSSLAAEVELWIGPSHLDEVRELPNPYKVSINEEVIPDDYTSCGHSAACVIPFVFIEVNNAIKDDIQYQVSVKHPNNWHYQATHAEDGERLKATLEIGDKQWFYHERQAHFLDGQPMIGFYRLQTNATTKFQQYHAPPTALRSKTLKAYQLILNNKPEWSKKPLSQKAWGWAIDKLNDTAEERAELDDQQKWRHDLLLESYKVLGRVAMPFVITNLDEHAEKLRLKTLKSVCAEVTFAELSEGPIFETATLKQFDLETTEAVRSCYQPFEVKHYFSSLDHFKMISEQWESHYNSVKPPAQ